MPSQTYQLFGQAMAGRKQILCLYDGFETSCSTREISGIVLLTLPFAFSHAA